MFFFSSDLQVEQGVAADRDQSSRKLGSSSKDSSKAEMGLAGAYRQHLQLFLQVRLADIYSYDFEPGLSIFN